MSQCINPIVKIITDYFNSTQNPTPTGFTAFLNVTPQEWEDNGVNAIKSYNECNVCEVGCGGRYIFASVDTYFKYGEVFGLTDPAPVP
jgi:hypothetical protein